MASKKNLNCLLIGTAILLSCCGVNKLVSMYVTEKIVEDQTINNVHTYPLLEEVDNKIYVDFTECKPSGIKIYRMFGSTVIQVRGKDGDYCIMRTGGETESPNDDGFLYNECRVPVSVGKIMISSKESEDSEPSFHLEQIDKYCSEREKPWFYTWWLKIRFF